MFMMAVMTITHVVTDTFHPTSNPSGNATGNPTGLSAETAVPASSDLEPEFRLAAVDLYRDIHKGIRAELLAVTSNAGNIDPAYCGHRKDLARHLDKTARVLTMHAYHEHVHLDPLLREHLPALAEQVD